MEEDEVVRGLLAEVVKNGETAIYILANQPDSRDFKIVCGCGGISFSSIIYFSEKKYREAMGDKGKAAVIRQHFIRYFGGLQGEVPIVGCCQKCGSGLNATIAFRFH